MTNQIIKDLKESKISLVIALSFIPIAFLTYLFHEFGHWVGGELFGNDMILGLNYATPRSGYFIKEIHALWSSIGGPAFTIIQALIFGLFAAYFKSILAYSISFFAVFSRFFSIVFGGINQQDEARMALFIGVSKYLIAGIVLLILFTILFRVSKKLNFGFKEVGYYTILSVFSVLVVIATYSVFY